MLNFTRLPFKNWIIYQEWVNVIFIHYKVPAEVLKKFVPFEIDTFQNAAYISIVAFKNENTKPPFFIPISILSDFGELNIRTYVNHQGKKGIYFLSIEGGKQLSSFIARKFSTLPYRYSNMEITSQSFESSNKKDSNHFKVDYQKGEFIPRKTELETWLTERYSLFNKTSSGKIIQFDVYHKEWPLTRLNITNLQCNYRQLEPLLNNTPFMAHYSPGVQVYIYKG